MKTNFLKKHADFLLIIAFFAIPPIFSSGQNVEQISDQQAFSPAAPLSTLLMRVALCLYILFKVKFGKKDFKSFSFASTLSILCILLLNAFLWNFIAGFFSSSSKDELEKIMPEGLLPNFYVWLSLFVSAFYEEILYRKFLPDESFSICSYRYFNPTTIEEASVDSKQNSLKYRIIVESLIILIFALGHRYLGVWAVLNAVFAGGVLRFFCVKTGSFLSGFTAHLIYNLIVFFLL